MEDAHSVVLDLDPDGKTRIAWFAVFDGHGGTESPPLSFEITCSFLFPFFLAARFRPGKSSKQILSCMN